MKQLSMELRDRRVRLAELLLGVDEETLIHALEKLMASAGVQRSLSSLTQEELTSRLDEAMEDAREWRVTNADDLLKEVVDWK